MKVAVPREIAADELRVALVPDAVATLREAGMEVAVESAAGHGALVSDSAYVDAGAAVEHDPVALYESADAVLKVERPVMNEAVGRHEADMMKPGALLVGFLRPSADAEMVRKLADNRITAFSMDAVPRTARAQSMDALTSMASLAGYKGALIASNALNRFMPMMITAAGTLAPAKGLVIGAGVAGLQAIATARRMGAVMFGYDVRPAVGEQVRSLGASFVEPRVVVAEAEHASGYAKQLSAETQHRESDILAEHIAAVDFVITTAAVPGRPAPKIVTEAMVAGMRPGGVIVDIAAETGGNCALTRPGETVTVHGVAIHGPLGLPSTIPVHASQMYSRNIANFLLHVVGNDGGEPDFGDDITMASCITHDGEIVGVPADGQVKEPRGPAVETAAGKDAVQT